MNNFSIGEHLDSKLYTDIAADDLDKVKIKYGEHPKSPLSISWKPAQSRSHHHELDLGRVSDFDTWEMLCVVYADKLSITLRHSREAEIPRPTY